MTINIQLGDIVDLHDQLPQVDCIYIDPPFATQKDHGDFDDRWINAAACASSTMERVDLAWQYLKSGGNLLIHVDWRTAPWIRTWMEPTSLIGENATFQNEIIWKYNSGGASKRRLSRKHDNILWYTKDGADYTFNTMREPYPHEYKGKGFHPEGKMLSDVWTDIGFIGTSSPERVGYATQKPVKLLERIVTLFTNPGDTVLDFYCGSGTTGVAADNLGRNAILIDKNPVAIEKATGRLFPS
jgi:site-specific DNA-methyltransferase (adenine-specific)